MEEMQNMCDVLDRVEKRGIEQGIEQGIIEGAEEQAKMTALNLQKMGMNPADIARAIDRSVNIVQKWLGIGIA